MKWWAKRRGLSYEAYIEERKSWAERMEGSQATANRMRGASIGWAERKGMTLEQLIQWREDRAERKRIDRADLRRRRALQRAETRERQRLPNALRSRVAKAIKARGVRKEASALELTGATVSVIRAHLESLFQPGMTWENHGKWHIDHIRPCASFDLTDLAQQKECFHYTNLQPLWAEDNLSKHDCWPWRSDLDNTRLNASTLHAPVFPDRPVAGSHIELRPIRTGATSETVMKRLGRRV